MLNSIYTAAAKLSRCTSGIKQAELNAQQEDPGTTSDASEGLDRFPPRPSSDRRGRSVDVRRNLPSPSGSGSLKVTAEICTGRLAICSNSA